MEPPSRRKEKRLDQHDPTDRGDTLMGTKNNPGEFDCYENAADDEPMFVLLARDPFAPMLVELWANMRENAVGNPSKVAEARRCARDMREFRRRKILAGAEGDSK